MKYWKRNRIPGSDLLRNLIRYPGILATLFLIPLFSCNNQEEKERISEGEIEYQIEYLDNERDNPFIMLLPQKMITSFSKNSSYTRIEGFFGTFKLTYILNHANQKNYTLLQIMDKKYVYQADINNPAFGYKNMRNTRLEYSDQQKMIAGYNCKHALAHFTGNEINEIEIFYTNEINLEKPNLNNPFREIDGVLMEFSVKLVGINMKFNATKISPKKINPELFEIPKGFTRITLTEMEKIVDDFNLSSTK